MPLSAAQTIPQKVLPSLGAAHGSVHVPKTGPLFRRFLSFAGPGYLVATGYMDPGNWATALAGGSKFGMALLFVAVLSSLMAIVLQALSARLAFATGRDLAQNCGQAFPRPARLGFWLIMELAIVATDLAEVIGTAIGLELLTGLPLGAGVVLTSLDALLILAFMRFGFRKLEAFVVALLILIASCFAVELVLARPDMADVAKALLPTRDLVTNPAMLYIALGILGATVMPHNLYLHSGIVLTRAVGPSHAEKSSAIRFAILDSTIALLFALLINGSILILAAAAFHAHGHPEVAELPDAYRLIAPLLGSALAAKLFAIALIACGLNSTLTATLAGQIVMEGFINIKAQSRGAAAGDQARRHRARRCRHPHRRRQRDKRIACPQPGRVEPHPALRGRSAGVVYRLARPHGRPCRTVDDKRDRRLDRGGDHRLECEARLRRHCWLNQSRPDALTASGCAKFYQRGGELFHPGQGVLSSFAVFLDDFFRRAGHEIGIAKFGFDLVRVAF